MIPKGTLKEILAENEHFILAEIESIFPRDLSLAPPLKKVAILYGTRRSGKSYILYGIFKKNKQKALYIDFEDERLTDFETSDFERLREAFLELKPELGSKEIVYLLDEIQNVSGWEKFCRRLVEKTKSKVFVTGSSSKIMPQEIHTALRGRSWGTELLPFSFREFLTVKQVHLQDSRNLYGPLKTKLKNEFMEYLQWGGFPEVAILDTAFAKKKTLKEYLDAMFFKDLVERYQVTNTALLERLMDMLFSSASLKISLSSFYKKMKEYIPFSKDFLYEYYNYFLQSLLVFEVRIFSPSSYKRSRNPAKCYLVDTGLAKKISSKDLGRLLENIVYLQYRRLGFNIHYFAGKNECDFIVQGEEEDLSCVQVTWELTDQNKAREIDGLMEACKATQCKKGMIVTLDEEEAFEKENIFVEVVPAWKWLLQ